MITTELIKTKVGAACARLGQPIRNAYDWEDAMPDNLSLSEWQQAILDEIAVMEAEEASAQIPQGIDTGLGWLIPTDPETRNLVEGFLTLKGKAEAKSKPLPTEVRLLDTTGTVRILTPAQAEDLAEDYLLAYTELHNQRLGYVPPES